MKVKNNWYKDYYDDFLSSKTLNTPAMHKIAKDEVSFNFALNQLTHY